VLGTLCAAVHGATIIVPAEYFTPRSVLSTIETERATAVYGVPTMFIAELADPTFHRRDLTSLRTGIMAGSPCPAETVHQVVHRMGARELTIAYGQTEASPVITQTHTDDSLTLRVDTVGCPLPGVEVKIVDPVTGDQVASDVPGELCCRGHVVMLGYYKQPEATAATIDDQGWLHTGDVATKRTNGYYCITGRLKDMVIRGGENIYPREIEECLTRHPSLLQSAVIAVPDPRFGEELCAWVKLKPDQQLSVDELREFCRHQLAHFKVPRYIRFVDEFPRSTRGEIQKARIRQLMERELELRPQDDAGG
jgi:fatty-acyl-CoA synthase